MFLRELDALVADSEKFPPKLTVLIEDVEHHVMEEEGQMFKMVDFANWLQAGIGHRRPVEVQMTQPGQIQ